MDVKNIILKCLDDNTDVSCRHPGCDLPDLEVNIGECCHKCSVDILREYDKQVVAVTLDSLMHDLLLCGDAIRNLSGHEPMFTLDMIQNVFNCYRKEYL